MLVTQFTLFLLRHIVTYEKRRSYINMVPQSKHVLLDAVRWKRFESKLESPNSKLFLHGTVQNYEMWTWIDIETPERTVC